MDIIDKFFVAEDLTKQGDRRVEFLLYSARINKVKL